MIDLVYQNGLILVYKIEDWEILRKEYRIIGNFLGSTQYVPALPTQLLPEEAVLLFKNNVAQLVKYRNISNQLQTLEEYKQFEQKLLAEEKNIYVDMKLKTVQIYIDKIMKGKHKKGDLRSKEEILKDEINKVVVNENNMIWPILSYNSNIESEPDIELQKDFTRLNSNINSIVFEDLWQKGYCVTSGQKFGGDYLVYEGDPLMYHAVFIVKCLDDPETNLHTSELIAFGRLSTSVKKRALLATVSNDVVKYITINW
ncbi:PREDICTED: tRNA-splicing endonuclease subunit Sen34, partial [Nicrophorus vespilloides]|uniref:tRNA-splicing endonuclease subunit Sen34 n=1 Tax=Nicrophorus vespilloides TaxID=110193 RepID=A0ABM1MAX1_NICVS